MRVSLHVHQVFARTSQHFRNLSAFLHSKLPPGFPVKFHLPVVPSVSANVEFLSADVMPAGTATAAGGDDRDVEGVFALPPDFRDWTGRYMQGKFFSANAEPEP